MRFKTVDVILELKEYLAKMNNLPNHHGAWPQEAPGPMQLHHLHQLTSIAACLESCKGAERRPTIYSWLMYDILVLHFKRQPLSAGWYVFLYKVRAFRTCL